MFLRFLTKEIEVYGQSVALVVPFKRTKYLVGYSFSGPSRQVLGVSHSSMLKITLATLLDVPLNMIRSLGQDNCAINALDYDTVSGSFEAVLVNNNIYRGRGAAFSAATHAAVTS